MALAFTLADGVPIRISLGNVVGVFVDIDFDSALAAGGEAIAPGDVGLTVIYGVIPVGQDTPLGVHYVYDRDGGKITAYETGAAADAVFAEADGDDVGGCTFLVIGK